MIGIIKLCRKLNEAEVSITVEIIKNMKSLLVKDEYERRRKNELLEKKISK